MMLSLPLDAWLLLFVAVGLGLGLEIAFYARHRADGDVPMRGGVRDAHTEHPRSAPPSRGSASGPPDPKPTPDA